MSGLKNVELRVKKMCETVTKHSSMDTLSRIQEPTIKLDLLFCPSSCLGN